MSWNKLTEIKTINSDNETEVIQILSNGNFYRIQNEWGNLSFEFDLSSGYRLAEELSNIVNADIHLEIERFLDETSFNDIDDRQLKLFPDNLEEDYLCESEINRD